MGGEGITWLSPVGIGRKNELLDTLVCQPPSDQSAYVSQSVTVGKQSNTFIICQALERRVWVGGRSH